MGLFSLGETMVYQLTKSSSVLMIYAFAFAIDFLQQWQKLALMAIAKKAKRD